MKISTVVLVLCVLFVGGCKKKNDKPVIIVTPNELIKYGNPGDVVDWNISITSEVKLARLIVKIQPINEYEQVYKDTLLYSKNFSWKLQYLIPQSQAGKTLYFNFTVVDEDGNEGVALKQIQVGDKLLSELTGLQFNTRSNPGNNAFDLEGIVATSSFSDSTIRDIQEYALDTTLQSPTYIWYSPAGGKFVQANNYDYANATALTAQTQFTNSVKEDFTDSLIVGDIYISKLGSTTVDKYMVIRITGITDGANNSDVYTFNIKK
ncbi:MAG: hypothetical protein ABI772_04040 [Bacteroidota bacterium]